MVDVFHDALLSSSSSATAAVKLLVSTARITDYLLYLSQLARH